MVTEPRLRPLSVLITSDTLGGADVLKVKSWRGWVEGLFGAVYDRDALLLSIH